ncbi:MAG: hypothetical protein R2795_00980 [Saprospiraceae bacterium]
MDKMQAAESEAELLLLWQQMQAEVFISYKVILSMIDKKLCSVPHCDWESKELGMSEADNATALAYNERKNTRIWKRNN